MEATTRYTRTVSNGAAVIHAGYLHIVSTLLILFGLAACGGGGGGGGSSTTTPASTIISGTAAAGAPVVGYVSVYDSSIKTQPVKTDIPIDANGHYSVDVAGLSAPYAFLARGYIGGTAVKFYSAATSADAGGTINITPFTDLIIRNIAAAAIDTYIGSGGFSNLTAAQLNAKRDALTNQLAPALVKMGLTNSIDLLRAAFSADASGLDRFMIAVDVSTTATTATIANKADLANALTIDTSAGGTATGTLSTAGLAPAGMPLDDMLATMNAFSAFFATAMPASPYDPNLLALFSSTFMETGQDSTAYLNQITAQKNLVGMKFVNFVLDSIDPTGTIAQMHVVPISAAGERIAASNAGGAIGMQMKKNAVTGVWQFDGDQRIAQVAVQTTANKFTCNPANPACAKAATYITGLLLEVNNPGAQLIGSALITGPGLPPAGVAFAAAAGQINLGRTTVNPNPCAGCGPEWAMTDANIAQVSPNSVYTIKLFDNSPAPVLLATYIEVVSVAPVLNTALVALPFPSVSGMVNLAGMGAATLTPSWTIPSGLWGDNLFVFAQQTATNTYSYGWDFNLLTSSGNSSIAINAPATGSWTSGFYTISARDQDGGKRVTNYQ